MKDYGKMEAKSKQETICIALATAAALCHTPRPVQLGTSPDLDVRLSPWLESFSNTECTLKKRHIQSFFFFPLARLARGSFASGCQEL